MRQNLLSLVWAQAVRHILRVRRFLGVALNYIRRWRYHETQTPNSASLNALVPPRLISETDQKTG